MSTPVLGLSSDLQVQIDGLRNTSAALQQVIGPERIRDLDDAIRRLEKLTVHIAAFGEVNAGKSALLNSLVGADNDHPETCPFRIDERPNTWSEQAALANGVSWRKVEGIELVLYDTPGIAGDIERHLDVALSIARKADVILYVVFEPIKGSLQVPVVTELLRLKKPVIFIVNKIDLRRPKEVEAIANDVAAKFSVDPGEILRAAGHPRHGSLVIEDVTQRLVTLVTERQHQLIHATVDRMTSDEVKLAWEILESRLVEEQETAQHETGLIEAKNARAKEDASSVISTYAKRAALSAGLLPLGFDAAVGSLISSGMLFRIARIYDRRLNLLTLRQIAKGLFDAFTGVFFISGASLAAYFAIATVAKAAVVTFAIGMAMDYVFTRFLVYAIGHSFAAVCAQEGEITAEKIRTAMEEYVRINITEGFIEKLPKRYRAEVLKLINPELLNGIDKSGDLTRSYLPGRRQALEPHLAELHSLTGLGGVKQRINELVDHMIFQESRKENGLSVSAVSLHMVFTGNPGTGKTTVARIVAKLLHQLGLVSKGQFIETDRTGLVSRYVGETAHRTTEIVEQAVGGVLFIDEAYGLITGGGGTHDYGQEAIDTLLRLMENHRDDLVVIVAGYTEPMKRFIASNPGLQSRFNTYVGFDDYTPDELAAIFESLVTKEGDRLSEAARETVFQVCRRMYDDRDPKSFGNGRAVRNLYEKTLARRASRVMRGGLVDRDVMTTIESDDISDAAGLTTI